MKKPPGCAVARLLGIPGALRREIAPHQDEEHRTGRTRHERGLPCLWNDWRARHS